MSSCRATNGKRDDELFDARPEIEQLKARVAELEASRG